MKYKEGSVAQILDNDTILWSHSPTDERVR